MDSLNLVPTIKEKTMTPNPLSARNGLFSMITHPVIFFSPLVSR